MLTNYTGYIPMNKHIQMTFTDNCVDFLFVLNACVKPFHML